MQLEAFTNHMEEDTFIIEHQYFLGAKKELLKCLNSFGKTAVPRCFSILGPSGSGKSTVIEDFALDFPEFDNGSGITRPVLVVETPSNPTLKAMASAVLQALGDPLYSRGTEVQMTDKIIIQLKAQGVRLIIIDEMQNLIDRDSLVLNLKTADWLKGLINRARVPTVIVGLEQTAQLFLANEQLRRRFRSAYHMESFDWHDPQKCELLLSFLKSLQDQVQFEDGLIIYKPAMAYRFFCATNGLVSYIVDIVREAKELASESHLPVITIKHLADAYVNVVCGNNGLMGVNPFSHENENQLASALSVVAPSLVSMGATQKKKGSRASGAAS